MAVNIQVGKIVKTNKGFAYIALLASLAVLMLALTAASESIAHSAKREKEQQLFFVGEQFRNAIASYYQNAPNGVQQYPDSLEVLLTDNRAIKSMRHLRRIYLDPMTSQALWGLLKNEHQRVIGVYSLSTEEVLKTNIDTTLVTVLTTNATIIYSDLKFIYTPKDENVDGEGEDDFLSSLEDEDDLFSEPFDEDDDFFSEFDDDENF
ncbi:MAG: type II secretion system protein [Methylophagaceae bacterium]